jgi:hypothetical protein
VSAENAGMPGTEVERKERFGRLSALMALRKAGLAPTKARPALHTNFCSTKSEESTANSSLTQIGLPTENEQSLIEFEKLIF